MDNLHNRLKSRYVFTNTELAIMAQQIYWRKSKKGECFMWVTIKSTTHFSMDYLTFSAAFR